MVEIPLDEIFDAELMGRPATYTADTAVGDETEIVVRFRRDQSDMLGSPGYAGASPIVWAKTTDVPNISINSRIVVHYGYLLDENGEQVLDEAGDPIIVENEFTYYVTRAHASAYGITEIQVSLTPAT